MLRAIPLLAGAAILLVAHPTAGQVTEKEVLAEVKAASKAQLKAFKQNMSAALTSLNANLEGIENLTSEGSDATTVGAQCANVAIEFITTLNEDFSAAKGFVEGVAKLGLVDLADGSDLHGAFPKDLYLGIGGLLDTSKAQLVKAGTKARDAAIKRLRKTADKTDKLANIAMCFDMIFPTRSDASCLSEDEGLGIAQGVTLDIVFSASDRDALNDGLLVFGGMTDSDDDVNVGYYLTIGVSNTDIASPSDNRFTALFTEVPEGGAIVHAKQGTGGTFHATAAIGVR